MPFQLTKPSRLWSLDSGVAMVVTEASVADVHMELQSVF